MRVFLAIEKIDISMCHRNALPAQGLALRTYAARHRHAKN
jgi:hypothetical protein